jgi:3-keto-disaccharide hydrolase
MTRIAALFLLAALAQDFAPLFNGKDLTGWEAVGGTIDCWSFQDGKVVCKGGKGGWLCTKEQFGDFEVEMDYNVPAGGNSGVFIRAPREGHTSKLGMEIQLLDDDADIHKNIKPAQHTASIYLVVPPSKPAQKKAGEWGTINIRCRGDQVTITLNGEKVVDADMSKHEELKNRPRKGFLGLQNHGSGVEFRNVRIKKLD